MTYAENTTVSVERSRAEIESILHKYGCKGFGYRYIDTQAVIEFATADRMVRFSLTLPSKEQFTYRIVRRLKSRCTPDQQSKLWEQACRQRWRALLLSIKAKLEAVQSGISEFEEEFLSHIIDPATRQTIGEMIRPEIQQRYLGNHSGQLLLSGPVEPKGGGDA